MTSPWTAAYAVSSPRTSTSLMGSDGARRTSVSAASSVPDILDRPRDKTRADEVSQSALQFLFAEMVSYCQERVSGIAQFEQLLGSMGRRVGIRLLVLVTHRTQMASNPKRPQRETRLLKTLLWLHTSFWKSAFGFQADSLERSTENMISSNKPLFASGISVPKDMSQLSIEAFTAGIVEGALEGLGFVRFMSLTLSQLALRPMRCPQVPIPTGRPFS